MCDSKGDVKPAQASMVRGLALHVQGPGFNPHTDDTAHKSAIHKVSQPRVLLLTLVLATYMPVEFSLCFICCAL